MADQLADIKAKGSLVCGVLGTSKPFSFPNPQTREIQGYDVDFCSAVAKSLGVKLEIKPISVAARIPELTQKRIDVIAAMFEEEHAEAVAAALFFCDPLNSYTTGQMLGVDGGWAAGYGRNF